MKHKLFTTLLVMLMSMTGSKAFAHDTEINGIYYNFSGSEATVTYKGNSSSSYSNEYSGSIVIPETIEYNNIIYTVTSIDEGTFYFCTDLTSIEIPSSVSYIGSGAFYYCNSLSSVVIPNAITSIEEHTFEGCSSLISVVFPSSLNKIEDKAFRGCYKITSIDLPSSVTKIGNQAFQYCGGFSSLIISKNVTYIGNDAFNDCYGLESIKVEKENSIYDSRNDCNAIIETNTNSLMFGCMNTIIPNGVMNINGGAFTYCTGLTFIEIPSSVKSIGDYAFYSCKNLVNIIVPSSVKNLGNGTFGNCESLTSFEIPDGIKRIGDGTFSRCISFSSIEIPNSVTTIGENAFWNCIGLSKINIPSSVTSIENGAFEQCSLESVEVNWITPIAIEANTFAGSENTTLYVPRGSKAAYEAADYWKDFKEVIEYDAHATIAMGSSGIATYSNNSDLNFTSVSGMKAYIASGYNPATGDLTMTRVYIVPAGEGLILKGAAGSYDVPYEETSAYYANLLVGVPTATTVNPTDGDYTNFILANDEVKGIGFYPLASAGEIGPNKAYLQLPTSILPAASRSLRMVFEDEEDVTGISAMKREKEAKPVFDLQGRRVEKPTRGLYIKEGKKIMVK